MKALVAALCLCLPAWAQNFDDYEIHRMAVGYTFTDGPAWSPQGFLVFSDVPANRIWKLAPGEEPELFREDAQGAAGNAFDRRGRLYTVESHSRRLVVADRRGRTEVVVEGWEGKKLNSPNDVVVRRDGHLYFTDPAFGSASDTRELDFYGVYHVTPQGEMELVAKPAGRPNGIALSPDGMKLYVAISDDRSVLVYDLDRNGAASGERIFIRGIVGPPDGMTVDEKGDLYIAANDLAVYSPSGELLASIEFAQKPSNCTFGDPDLGTLYITARTAVFAVRFGVKGASQR